MIFGDVLDEGEFYISTACNDNYLINHAHELALSCALAKNNFHLHLINPTDTALLYAEKIKKIFSRANKENSIKITYDHVILPDNPEEKRTYYACSRFLIAPELLDRNANLLFVDTDCLIMKHIEKPKTQIGLFLREPLPGTQGWENEGSRVAAGVVYYSKEALFFAEEVAANIKYGPFQWFLDQRALNQAYKKYRDKLTITQFDNKFMDWEFVEGTAIWTGKGERKYNNPVYVSKKKEFEDTVNLIKAQLHAETV